MPRNKTAQIALRLTPLEKEKLSAQAAQARMSMSEYLLALSEQKKIIIVDGIPELCIQISKIGTNINQIARVVNQNRNCSEKQLKMLQSDVSKLHDKLSAILDAIYDARDDIKVQ